MLALAVLVLASSSSGAPSIHVNLLEGVVQSFNLRVRKRSHVVLNGQPHLESTSICQRYPEISIWWGCLRSNVLVALGCDVHSRSPDLVVRVL